MKITREQQYKVNMICLYLELMDMYLFELQPNINVAFRSMTRAARKRTKELVYKIGQTVDDYEDFGDIADEIRSLVEKNITLELPEVNK